MDTLDDEWELSPDDAHPNARRLMKAEFFWDVTDEDSPFGNDTGADTLEFYRAWIVSSDEDEEFLDALFDEWAVDRELAETLPDDELPARLDEDGDDILTYDDVVIATAFAQLVLEGNASRFMAAAAQHCLERQALPAMIAYRNWSDPQERRKRCAEMLEVMRAAV